MCDLEIRLERIFGLSRDTRRQLSQIKCLSVMEDEYLRELAIYVQSYCAARRGELITAPTAIKAHYLSELISAVRTANLAIRDAHPDLLHHLAIEMRAMRPPVPLGDLRQWLTSAEAAAETVLGKLQPRVTNAPKISFARDVFFEHMDCLWQAMKDASRPHPPRSTVSRLLNNLLPAELKLAHGDPASLEAAAKRARKRRQ